MAPAKMPKMKKTKEHLYNAMGAPEAGEAMDETPGFKKGGKAKKRAEGGKVEGEKEKHRSDKKPRGEHHKRASGGRTPYTSGHNTSDAMSIGDKNDGHESQRPG